jgi:CDP-6-deoxy-D-xylo-4-hexulose-3-dehydrase
MSSFSTYFGHTMSTIEGGMICTNDKKVYEIIKQLRSHGWDRDLEENSKEKLRDKWNVDDFSALYTFYVPGFNLRSTDLQAVIGIRQLENIDVVINKRNENFQLFKYLLSPHTWFPTETQNSFTASFCIPIIASSPQEKSLIVKSLIEDNIECRPLICGSMGTQPFYIKKYGRKELINVSRVDSCGLYVPNHPGLTNEEIKKICNCIIQAIK